MPRSSRSSRSPSWWCSSCASSASAKAVPMLELLTSPEAWIAFGTLTALELVLGIDNVIFISILVDKLSSDKREIARRLGLFLAMFMRIGLLFLLSWLVGLTAPLWTVPFVKQEI